MMSVPTEVVIKTDSIDKVKDAFKVVSEIKKANPYVVIKPIIEIDLRNRHDMS